MADFGASYAEMEAMSNKLSAARDDIQGQLDQLKSAVDDLLGNDFKTQHASGKFGQGYEELTTGLKTATDGIGDMGDSLKGMMQAIQDLDQQLAGG
ncbi:WXG100 family type VII secretion target [Glaciibacter flavus]